VETLHRSVRRTYSGYNPARVSGVSVRRPPDGSL